jgi:hypothetical protein
MISFSFLVSSMNAPVMVELEGETDPLEVGLFNSYLVALFVA